MANDIKPIETRYNGYRFRSRLEARWAVFFHALGLEYQYEMEGYEMDGIRYLPDFFIPSINRWFEIKGKPLSIPEIKKCEEMCARLEPNDIKFSILIGAPQPIVAPTPDGKGAFLGIEEYTWEWPTSRFLPADEQIYEKDLVSEEYYSRFVHGIWMATNGDSDSLLTAVKKSREARFEFGEHPD